jgi:hypothetical protein
MQNASLGKQCVKSLCINLKIQGLFCKKAWVCSRNGLVGPVYSARSRSRTGRFGLLGQFGGRRPFSFSKMVSNLVSKVKL